jgi:hypothetical protein
MAVEAGGAEIKVAPESIEGCTVCEKKANGADVTIVGTPPHQRHAVAVSTGGGVSCGEIIEDPIGAALDYLLE